MKRFLASGAAMLLAACAAQPRPVAVAAPPPSPPPATQELKAPTGDQWLYGGAEGSVASLQAFRALTDYAVAAAKSRPADSVVLAPGSDPTGTAPLAFVPCGNKPLAAVFDADETLIWNIPPARHNLLHSGGKFDMATWDSWEKTGAAHAPAMPGAVQMVAALRAAGITPIANTNREAKNAAGTEAALKAAGLGDFVHGQTLFLKGDDADGSSKDGRRATIASRYCVITMAGDQLGDFAQAFNAKGLSRADRKRAALSGPASTLWNRGWFLLSNSSYGPWAGGSIDDVYGPETWVPGQGEK